MGVSSSSGTASFNAGWVGVPRRYWWRRRSDFAAQNALASRLPPTKARPAGARFPSRSGRLIGEVHQGRFFGERDISWTCHDELHAR